MAKLAAGGAAAGVETDAAHRGLECPHGRGADPCRRLHREIGERVVWEQSPGQFLMTGSEMCAPVLGTIVGIGVGVTVVVAVAAEVWDAPNRKSVKPGPNAETIVWSRVVQILTFVLFWLLFAVIGAWAILDSATVDLWFPCKGIVEGLASLAGLLAFGSLGAFGTAFLTTMMKRVKYDQGRRGWKRAMLCVQRTSRLELLVRIWIGASVGGGAYLFTQL